MDVIESLKSKTEEENGNCIESSEETDGNEDGGDLLSASAEEITGVVDGVQTAEANIENSEITGVVDGVQTLNKSKLKRSRKHREVDVGESSLGAGRPKEGNDSPSSPLHMQSDDDFQ